MQVTRTIRRIGNSFGLILPKKMMEDAGITDDVVIEVTKSGMTISPAKKRKVNLDLSTWREQFKLAFSDGHKPEPSPWEHSLSANDKKEWNWNNKK